MQEIDKGFNSLYTERILWYLMRTQRQPQSLWLCPGIRSIFHIPPAKQTRKSGICPWRLHVLRPTHRVFWIHQNGGFKCGGLQQRFRGEDPRRVLRLRYGVSMKMHRGLIKEHNLVELHIGTYFFLKFNRQKQTNNGMLASFPLKIFWESTMLKR